MNRPAPLGAVVAAGCSRRRARRSRSSSAGCAVGRRLPRARSWRSIRRLRQRAGRHGASPPAADIAAFWRGFGDADAVGADRARPRRQRRRPHRPGAAAGIAGDAAGRARRAAARDRRCRRRQPLADARIPAARRIAQPAQRRSFYDAGFTANWELDFFGRNRRASESAAAQVDASVAGVHAAQTVVAAEVARNYLELRGLQLRVTVARDSIVNQRESLAPDAALVSTPGAARSSTSRARRPSYDSTEATLPALQVAIDRSAYRIATLAARAAARDRGRGSRRRSLLPTLPVTDLSALPLGTPEQLLRRRPDPGPVAERQLAAATADDRRRHRRPLSARQPGRPDRLRQQPGEPIRHRASSQQYSLVAGLTWPLLDFGRVRSRIAAQRGACPAGACRLRADRRDRARGNRGRAQPVHAHSARADRQACQRGAQRRGGDAAVEAALRCRRGRLPGRARRRAPVARRARCAGAGAGRPGDGAGQRSTARSAAAGTRLTRPRSPPRSEAARSRSSAHIDRDREPA